VRSTFICATIFVLTLAALTLPSHALSFKLPKLKAGEDYSSVRSKMLSDGWVPFHSKDADNCAEFDRRCKGRPEVEACSGTGLGYCKFLWKKGKKIIALCTVDDPAKFDGKCDYP
jgi:hypothetical protein